MGTIWPKRTKMGTICPKGRKYGFTPSRLLISGKSTFLPILPKITLFGFWAKTKFEKLGVTSLVVCKASYDENPPFLCTKNGAKDSLATVFSSSTENATTVYAALVTISYYIIMLIKARKSKGERDLHRAGRRQTREQQQSGYQLHDEDGKDVEGSVLELTPTAMNNLSEEDQSYLPAPPPGPLVSCAARPASFAPWTPPPLAIGVEPSPVSDPSKGTRF